MKRLLLIPVAVLLSLSFVGCGASAEDDSTKTGDPGTSEKDWDSNTERQFQAPDEFYDYGDYAYVKVIHLTDGTRCVMAADRENGGMGVTCQWPTDEVTSVPSVPSDTTTP